MSVPPKIDMACDHIARMWFKGDGFGDENPSVNIAMEAFVNAYADSKRIPIAHYQLAHSFARACLRCAEVDKTPQFTPYDLITEAEMLVVYFDADWNKIKSQIMQAREQFRHDGVDIGSMVEEVQNDGKVASPIDLSGMRDPYK